MGFLTAKGRGSGSGAKKKRGLADDDLGMVYDGLYSDSATPNVANPLGKEGVLSGINSTPTSVNSVPNVNPPTPVSFANLVTGDKSQKSVNFRPWLRWLGKFGLVKIMNKDMFFFKFGSKEGMTVMLENGSWLIRIVSLILEQWTSDANIMKEDVCNIPVWVKFHDVLITAFTKDGLSAIATELGNLSMLDSYTATMCTDS
ncbi:zinc knuckle CX2CX4HX4C containing protein [Tanacetum coccineum]